MSLSSPTPTLELKNIRKTFGGVVALSSVSFSAYPGEVHALMGGNGAGKSTLMKVLSGVYPAPSHEGEIWIHGHRMRFNSPADSERSGIAMIHQELSAFPHLSVAENLCVGVWPRTRFGTIDAASMHQQALQWLTAVGSRATPEQRMGDLSVGQQQLIEIAKALARNSEILILDEPTSALTPAEVNQLFQLLRDLKSRGKTLIYISHKMEEIYAISDRITVIRDGANVGSGLASEVKSQELVNWMMGRPLEQAFPVRSTASVSTHTPSPSVPVLELKHFGAHLQGAVRPACVDVNLKLLPGEIVGLAGLLGAGRSELCRAILGDPRLNTQGEVWVRGKRRTWKTVREAMRQGFVYVSEDRKKESIFPSRSLEENVSLSRRIIYWMGKTIRLRRAERKARDSFTRLKVKYSDPSQPIRSLSGGNQQKVVMGRALATNPEVILLDEPTRGIDVGAKFEIYELIHELAAQGKAFLVVSSEIPELMGICDRILVLASGKVTGEFSKDEFNSQELLKRAVT